MRQIRVKLGKTYNIGNYESIRVDVEIAKEIGYSTSYQHACKDAFAEVRKAIKIEASKLIQQARGGD